MGIASSNANTSSSEAGFRRKLHVFLIYSVHCGVEDKCLGFTQ